MSPFNGPWNTISFHDLFESKRPKESARKAQPLDFDKPNDAAGEKLCLTGMRFRAFAALKAYQVGSYERAGSSKRPFPTLQVGRGHHWIRRIQLLISDCDFRAKDTQEKFVLTFN